METYNGHVRTPADAIILFEACRLGLLPRVQRRLSEKERQSIRSGSVFVWDEREAGMRRWTDGKSWSASRVSGSFLTYREMEGKRGGNGFAPPPACRAGKTPESGRNSGDDRDADGEEGLDGYRYKPDGLMKQSFSITTSTGQHLHLISYYARSHSNAPGLLQPTTDPNLRQIRPQKGMYPESTVNDQSTVPAVTRSPMIGAPNYVMSPQGPGYPRHVATHPQGYIHSYAHPAYHYPPSPMTPQSAYSMNHYGPPHGFPPIGSNGQYPGAYYGQHPMPVVQAQPLSYDQRPLRTPETTLPPPPQLPQYVSAPGPVSTPTYPPGLHLSYHAQSASERLSPLQNSATLQIDPRLFGSPATPSTDHNDGVAAPKPEDTAISNVNSRENGNLNGNTSGSEIAPTSAANQAPTIGSLLQTPNNSEGDTGGKAEQNSDRQASASPGGTKRNDAIQDIPSEKLGFREDKRALRQLDKVFTA